jgi:spermidine/putrescine-binding protein
LPPLSSAASVQFAVSSQNLTLGLGFTFLSADSKNAEAAKALIAYLSSPEAAAVYKARGMLPGR